MSSKSSIEQIRSRFDQDVERFSNLETGQSAAVDSALSLQLIAEAAAGCSPDAKRLLDLGAGAGNFTLRLLQQDNAIEEITLIDLSEPMLIRATERIVEAAGIVPRTFQDDLRTTELGESQFDIVLAGSVLHHLRTDDEWETTFQRIFTALRPGGSFWIFDLVEYERPELHELIWHRYGKYLVDQRDEEYRDHVFDYIKIEDSPRSLFYQLKLLDTVGFSDVDVLHCNTCFAAFGGIKAI